MNVSRQVAITPRMHEALNELRALISNRYPQATFTVSEGDDLDGLCLTATVDVEDMGEVVDVFLARLVDLQVDEDLPIDVLPVRPLARNLEILARQQAAVAAQAKAS